MQSLKSGKANGGFTLIELMIVVAIIGILAAIAIPKFADLIRKSNEGATKGNLGAIRSALSIYYGDMEGQYPYDPAELTTNTKYLKQLPMAKRPPYHADGNSISLLTGTGYTDGTNGWTYIANNSDANFGSIWVQCTHTDSKGQLWTSY
jgi:prepilin-type N-terminal cleavage/methylation domain-containing protein